MSKATAPLFVPLASAGNWWRRPVGLHPRVAVGSCEIRNHMESSSYSAVTEWNCPKTPTLFDLPRSSKGAEQMDETVTGKMPGALYLLNLGILPQIMADHWYRMV
jgi:hypothetical protein